MMAQVLKKDHSLVGHSPYALVKAIRSFDGTLPSVMARLKKDHSLERYSVSEMVGHLEGITGLPAKEIFDMAGIPSAADPENIRKEIVLFALHVAIMEANAHGQPKGILLASEAVQGSSGADASNEPRKEDAKQTPGKVRVTYLRWWSINCCYELFHLFIPPFSQILLSCSFTVSVSFKTICGIPL